MAASVKKGLSNQWLHNYIPDGPLDGAWFRDFCNRYLVNADVRNATAGPNVTITGNIGTPATISASGGTASPLTTKGDIWGYDTGNNRIPVGSNGQVLTADSTQALGLKWAAASGSVAVPGTIPDLMIWWESDNILGTNGQPIQLFGNRTPWLGGVCWAGQVGAGSYAATMDSATLNSLPIVKWQAAAGANYYQSVYGTSGGGSTFGFQSVGGLTFFVVIKPGSGTVGSQAILGPSAGGGLGLYLCLSGTAALCLQKSGTGAIATSTATWTAGSWFQANVTYNPTSGAYAFRQGRATAGSGTATTGVGTTVPTIYLGADQALNPLVNNAGLAAIIVYNRVLSGTEISSVESYLNTKWGV